MPPPLLLLPKLSILQSPLSRELLCPGITHSYGAGFFLHDLLHTSPLPVHQPPGDQCSKLLSPIPASSFFSNSPPPSSHLCVAQISGKQGEREEVRRHSPWFQGLLNTYLKEKLKSFWFEKSSIYIKAIESNFRSASLHSKRKVENKILNTNKKRDFFLLPLSETQFPVNS